MVVGGALRHGSFARAAVAAAVAVLACLAASPASAQTTQTTSGTVRDCHEIVALVNVPKGPVREQVPAQYTLYEETPGQATVYLRGSKCAGVDLSGREIPTYMANFGAVIESPDHSGCMSHGERDFGFEAFQGDYVKYCTFYPFYVATDNREWARWLRADGTSDYPVYVTRDWEWDLRPGLVPGQFGFRFRVGGSVPSPFELEGSGIEREGTIPLQITYWYPSGDKQVKLYAENDLKLGHATGEVRTPAGTDLARMLGATSSSFASGFGLNYFAQALLVKEIRSP
ncbi:MAG TPA: hypothetical protein VF517_03165 [Thermoleophilaceae bacterium]